MMMMMTTASASLTGRKTSYDAFLPLNPTSSMFDNNNTKCATRAKNSDGNSVLYLADYIRNISSCSLTRTELAIPASQHSSHTDGSAEVNKQCYIFVCLFHPD